MFTEKNLGKRELHAPNGFSIIVKYIGHEGERAVFKLIAHKNYDFTIFKDLEVYGDFLQTHINDMRIRIRKYFERPQKIKNILEKLI
mgnify:CR=1 FL=1